MFKKIEIMKVEGQGFRGFEKTFTFEMEPGRNVFIGDNGKGKSSIGELITWVLTGRSREGKQKELNVKNENVNRAVGKVIFRDENGDIHEVERRMNKTTSIKYNLEPITQKELEELIPADLFLNVFNPLYFSSLDREASRKTLFSFISDVEKEDVLEKMTAADQKLLENESFDSNSTNVYLKNRREELQEIEKDRSYLEGYIGKLKEKIEIPDEVTFNGETRMKEIREEIKKYQAMKPKLIDVSDLLKQKHELEKKKFELQAMVFPKEQEEQELKRLESSKMEEEKHIQNQVLDNKKEMVALSQKEVELASLRSEYKIHHKELQSLEADLQGLVQSVAKVHAGDNCPCCKQILDEQAAANVQETEEKSIEEQLSSLTNKIADKKTKLASLTQQGKTLAGEVEKLKKVIKEAQSAFKQETATKLDALRQELKQIKEKLRVIAKEKNEFVAKQQEEIQNINKQIDGLGLSKVEAENEKIEREFQTELQQKVKPLEDEYAALEREREVALRANAERQAKIRQKEQNKVNLKKCQEEMEEHSKNELRIMELIQAMKRFNAEKMKLVNGKLSAHLKDVSIQLQRVVQSTGELKDTFDIYYKGRPLAICSTSEQIKAGLELSQMMSHLSGCDYPVFVDNRESITKLDTVATQQIEVIVKEGKPLSKLDDQGEEKEIKPTNKQVAKSLRQYVRESRNGKRGA